MSSATLLLDEMPATVRTIVKIATVVEKIVLSVAILLGGLMTLVVLYGVIARYVVQNPAVWSEELARALMIWTAYLGISVVLKRRSHLGILFVVLKFPLPLQRAVKLLNDSLITIFLFILVVYGLDMVAAAKSQFEPATGITMNYPFSIVPICGILTLFQLLLGMAVDLSLWKTEISPYDTRLASL